MMYLPLRGLTAGPLPDHSRSMAPLHSPQRRHDRHGMFKLSDITFAPLPWPQALDTSLAYTAALRQAVKAQGAEKLVILNPGVAIDAGLAAQVLATATESASSSLFASCSELYAAGHDAAALTTSGGQRDALCCHMTPLKVLPWRCHPGPFPGVNIAA